VNVLLAVLVVGLGSLVVRVAPLLGARRLPEEISRLAGWAGVSVLAALTVRAVVLHEDDTLTLAPLYACVAVALGLFAAYAGRSVLVAVSIGAAAYVVLSAATAPVL
jgi:branched-subunit amino acid transport protein